MPEAGSQSGGGFMKGLEELFKNPLFLQYLSGAGAAVSQGQPAAAGLNAVTQGNISSQNYMAMLKKMLSGEPVPGSTLKVSDDGKTTFTLPPQPQGQGQPQNPNIGSPSIKGQPGGMPTPAAPTIQPGTPIAQGGLIGQGGLAGLANPFTSGQAAFSGADLAGLSPETITQALQLRFGQEELKRKTFTEVMDALYKGDMADVARRQATVSEREAAVKEAGIPLAWDQQEIDRLNAYRQMAVEMRQAPLEVPGVGTVDLAQWEKLDPKTKAYSYYVFDERLNNRKELGYNAWEKQLDPLELERLYERSKTNPEFKKFIFDYKRTGATTISMGERLSEKLSEAQLKAQFDLANPAALAAEARARTNSEDFLRRVHEAERKSPGSSVQMGQDELAKMIEGMIATGRGTIEQAYWDTDGRTGVWVVTWPALPGGQPRTETIRYAIR